MVIALICLFIIIAILGAILGGKGFGDTLRKGCVTIIIIVIVLIIIIMHFLSK